MMQSTIERLLYVTLLLVFAAAMASFYVIYAQGKQRTALIESQNKTIQELRKGVAEIKADNKQTAAVLVEQTKRTACLINLIVRDESKNPEDCPPIPPAPVSTTYVQNTTIMPPASPAAATPLNKKKR